MEESFLFIALLQNNELYIKYMKKMFDEIEKNNPKSNFDYFFYTNDNKDNTIKLLEKYNYNYFDDKEIKYKDGDRIKKLAYLRQKLLESINKKKSKYVILFDSDIFFNNAMFTKAMKTIKEKKFKITCLNTIKYPIPFFYDWLAYKNFNKLECLKLSSRTLFSNSVIETDTFFNGLMIFENNEDFKKYNYNFVEKDNFICEHYLLNKSIKKEGNNINIITNITPVYSEQIKPNKSIGAYKEDHYKHFYNLIENNKTDIRRNLFIYYFLILFLIICLVILIYKKITFSYWFNKLKLNN